MEWTDETIDRLRQLWSEGLSTAEIGRKMGISKNAVVGKAHRLLLSPRPSPIRREMNTCHSARSSSPKRVVGPTLPSLAAVPAAPPSLHASGGQTFRTPEPSDDRGRIEIPKSLRPLGLALSIGNDERRRLHNCCWPIGEPGTRSFRFCDDLTLSGKPYCGAHAALAYVKVRDRREDAA